MITKPKMSFSAVLIHKEFEVCRNESKLVYLTNWLQNNNRNKLIWNEYGARVTDHAPAPRHPVLILANQFN